MSLQSCFPHLTLDAGGYMSICYQFSEQKSRVDSALECYHLLLELNS
jgi:hypothetical protein